METPSNPKTEDYTYKQGQYSPRKRKDTTPKVNPQLAVELVFQELKRVEAYTKRIEDATAKKVEIDRGSLESAENRLKNVLADFERQGAVKVIEKRAPAAEDRRLILGACHGIIDVLIFHGLCIEPARELAHPVRVHRQIRDGLLDGQGRPAVTPSGAVFAVCLSQSHPPFSQRPAR